MKDNLLTEIIRMTMIQFFSACITGLIFYCLLELPRVIILKGEVTVNQANNYKPAVNQQEVSNAQAEIK